MWTEQKIEKHLKEILTSEFEAKAEDYISLYITARKYIVEEVLKEIICSQKKPSSVFKMPLTFSKTIQSGIHNFVILMNSLKSQLFSFSLFLVLRFDNENPWHGGPPINTFAL